MSESTYKVKLELEVNASTPVEAAMLFLELVREPIEPILEIQEVAKNAIVYSTVDTHNWEITDEYYTPVSVIGGNI